MSKTFRLDFDGMNEAIRRLENLGGNVAEATEKALQETYDYVTPNIKKELSKYTVRSGDMVKSFRNNEKVKWFGFMAQIKAGFDYDISSHALYHMITGTPYMKPNKKLYNALYGAKTKAEVKRIQQEVFAREIGKVM